MRFLLAAAAALLLSLSPAAAADLGALWRARLGHADDMFKHPSLAPVLRQLLGARHAEFLEATGVVVPVERLAGDVLIGTGCKPRACGDTGAFVAADTRRGEVLVVLAPEGRTGANRFERFATPGFGAPGDTVAAALQRWQQNYSGP